MENIKENNFEILNNNKETRNLKKEIIDFLTQYRTFAILTLILIVASLLSDSFLRITNITNLARQISIIGVIGVGMTLVILTGGIDLSVGTNVAITGAIAATIIQRTQSVFLAIIVSLIIGSVIGFINGTIITKAKLPPFIVTLGTMVLLRGVVLVFTQGSPIATKSVIFNKIGKGYFFGLPLPVIILGVTYFLGFILLKYTKLGRTIYGVGGNEEASRLSGINTSAVITKVYVMSGFLSAVAGLILTARLGSAQPTAGTGYELDAIAAVILGGTSLSGGTGSILGTLAGIAILGVLDNILVLMNVNPFASDIVKGTVIILAVLVDSKFKKLSLIK